jgi:hypothetical protein
MILEGPLHLAKCSPEMLFREMKKALQSIKSGTGFHTMHHSYGSGEPLWDDIKREAFEVPFRGQQFQVQLLLETHSRSGKRRVAMFCRRLVPRSSAPANAARGTFNSTNLCPDGFYMRPWVPGPQSGMQEALAVELPISTSPPFWRNNRIHLGDGCAPAILRRFLKATAVLEEIKGLEPAELARRYPPSPTFSSQEIQAVGLISEGRLELVARRVRKRRQNCANWRRNSIAGNLRTGGSTAGSTDGHPHEK